MRMAIWQAGFRPFFLGAGFWALTSMLIWFGLLQLNWHVNLNGLPQSIWHAHEMVFGYAVAVVAGFLLTAVPTWTGCQLFSGYQLVSLFCFWLFARLAGLLGGSEILIVTAFADLLFISGLFALIALPIIKHKQYRQFGILMKVLLLGFANIMFYLGVLGVLDNGVHYGLYTAFYLIIALILTLGGRVIPLFIRNGLALKVPLKNRAWVSITSLILFVIFWILEVFLSYPKLSSLIAMLLFLTHSIRLFDWYVVRVWAKPLLWVLYLSYAFIVFGFALKASFLFGFIIASQLITHMFAIGGVGLMTCGMMARVSLGHTGRSIHHPSGWIVLVFIAIALAAISRVFLPMISINNYFLWMMFSQIFWILGFFIFVILYFPILISPRSDIPSVEKSLQG